MTVTFKAVDLIEARAKADRYEDHSFVLLTYRETIGFIPDAEFVFDVKPQRYFGQRTRDGLTTDDLICFCEECSEPVTSCKCK